LAVMENSFGAPDACDAETLCFYSNPSAWFQINWLIQPSAEFLFQDYTSQLHSNRIISMGKSYFLGSNEIFPWFISRLSFSR